MSGWTRWATAAVAALEAYEADYGERLPDDHELGRIEESGGSPSFRIRAGHIRQIAAAPDLAAALTEAREIILDLLHSRWSEAEGTDSDWVGFIDAALLKARGE